MRAVVVVFHLPKGTPMKVHKQFGRAIYGENTSSWKGKYRYHRKGLLDDIPHVKLYWGSLILLERDLHLLERVFKAFSVEYAWREIKPLASDIKALEVPAL